MNSHAKCNALSWLAALQYALGVLGFLLLLAWPYGAQAQSSCRVWATFTSPAFSHDGTSANACAAYGTANGITVTSCTVDVNGTRVEYGAGSHVYLIDTGAGTCADDGATPPDPGASSPPSIRAELVLPAFLNLSIEDGLLISGAICGIWALAWALRAVARSLNTDGESSTND